MPNIEIDEDVMRELQSRAIRSGRMRFTANDVLRDVLKVGTTRSANTRENGISPANATGTTRRVRTGSGSVLLREHIAQGEISPDVKRGYYHMLGRSFANPREYPAVFFGPGGFVIINSIDDLQENYEINIGVNVNIPNGIENLQGYVPCSHTHSR